MEIPGKKSFHYFKGLTRDDVDNKANLAKQMEKLLPFMKMTDKQNGQQEVLDAFLGLSLISIFKLQKHQKKR